MSEPWFLRELTCPDCGGNLSLLDGIRCACGFSAPMTGQLDLRPQRPKRRTLELSLGCSAGKDLARVPLDRPKLTYHGPRALRDSSEFFSAAAPWLSAGSRLLDLGCGPRDQAVPAEHLKLEYVGVDFDSAAADILADGHAIPFRDDTFHAVLAYAVLEHLYCPALALHEITRVMRSGGVFFGAVSQGEPFHDSYFHHTAWGVMAELEGAGLHVVRLWASCDTLHALAAMGRYARLIRPLIEMVYRADRALPFLAPRRFFRGSARENQLEALFRSAAICFVAVKGKTEPAGD